jgi:hypothetical protein
MMTATEFELLGELEEELRKSRRNSNPSSPEERRLRNPTVRRNGDRPRQNKEWSVVDITVIPSMGVNLHDYCGRFCFSHAAALSPAMSPLKQDPQLLDKTLQEPQCWPDRQEFWKKL